MFWKRLIYYIPLFIFILFGCASPYRDEEPAVYAAYVDAYYIVNPVTHKQYDLIVVLDMTTTVRPSDKLPEQLKELQPQPEPSTVSNFLSSNRRYFGGFTTNRIRNGLDGRRPMNPNLKFSIEHVLISDSALEEIIGTGGYREFRRRFPHAHGFIAFSKVGFNPEMSEALLFFENWWGFEAGEGFLVLLRKNVNGWSVMDRVTAWVS